MNDYQLAQLNVAAMRYPLEDPRFKDFVDALDRVNARAEASPGFVWRLKSDAGNATAIRMYDDDLLLVNLSVWESVEQLMDFVRDPEHFAIMRRRREWFEHSGVPYAVLWWVAAGHQPDVAEAQARLDQLRKAGATASAFDFKTRFPPPEADPA